MSESNVKFSEQEALEFHAQGRPGKLEIIASKPMATQRDLSLAYSPGVAVPVRAIAEDPACAYDYTAKGNLVAVISNGTAILGLGNLGALAAKPVMEGKAVLFKRFADVDAIEARPDAIIATGRSDFPNQVNNVLGFPFIFRGALDVRATAINDEMKIAAAEALAGPAREPVPEEVAAAYGGHTHSFGRDYIIPAPFDPRLMEIVASAVAEAAMASGCAQKPIEDMAAYRQQLRGRLNPTVAVMSLAYEAARSNPKRVLFAEGEEPNVLRAAIAFKEAGYGTPVLVGREEVHDLLKNLGVDKPDEYEVLNSRNSPLVGRAVDFIYKKHQRHGLLRREVERMVNQDRNTFAAAMLALGEGDAMITGTTRPFSQSLRQVRLVIDDEADATPFGINLVVARHRTVLIADTAVTERPNAHQLAAIALRSASFARRMGLEPRIAFISYTTFGNPPGTHIEDLRGAVKLLDGINTDFEYEGEMAPDVALSDEMQRRYYPFSRLTGPANILIMPGLQSASLSAKLLRALSGESVLGPFLLGMKLPVQIAPMTAGASDLVTLAVLAAGA